MGPHDDPAAVWRPVIVPARARPWAIAGLWLAVAAGAALRWPLASQPPFDFAVMRQHHSALITRAIYYRAHPEAAPGFRRDAAADYVANATAPEPPILEQLAAWIYAAIGREDLRAPRGLSAGFWMAGALFLFAAARRLGGDAVALAAASVYLFLPYAFRASVSIQPDPFAVAWLCAGIYGLSRYADDPRPGRLIAAAALSAPAILARPMTACFLLPVAGVLVWRAWRAGMSLSPAVRWLAVFGVVAIGPAVSFFAYGLGTDAGWRTRVSATFVPALLADPVFWRGWARFAYLAFGPALFVAALAGAWFSPRGRMKDVLVALWMGYALYGLAFNLHVSTHPYYQTLAVPLIALSIGALVGPAARTIPAAAPVATTALPVFLLAMAVQQGVFTAPESAARIADYRAIGDEVGHSRRVVFLSTDWGAPLRYHGDFAGRYWPTRFEIEMYRPLGSSGIPDVSADARLAELSRQVDGVEFFVATDLDELARQPDLERLLADRFTLKARTDRYAIWHGYH